jgi:uncharacterized damage-inducible protein DinB
MISAVAGQAQTAPAAVTYNAEALAVLDEQAQKVISLAEAVPQDKYTWSPSAGVRSTAEVYLHIALANYAFASFLGVKPPEGFTFKGFEKSTTDKAKIVEQLKRSFDNLKQAVRESTDLEKGVKVFGSDATARDAILRSLAHNGEHMGQSIAYARMSGIVPPWTAAEEAERQAKQPAKK